MPGTDLIGWAESVLAMTLVGSSVAASSLLVSYPVLTGQAARYGLAAFLLFALGSRTGRLVRPTRRELGRIFVLATLGLGGFNVFLILALRASDPARVGVVVGAVPLVLAVLGPLQRRDPLRLPLLVAALAAVVGTGLVHGAGQSSWNGLVMAVGALLGEVAFTLIAVPLLPRLGAVTVSTAGCAIAATQLACLAPLWHGSGWGRRPEPAEALAIVFLAVAVTAIAFVLWYDALARIGAEAAGLSAGLVPVSAVIGSWAIGAVSLEAAQLVGTGVISAAVLMGLVASRGDRRQLLPGPESVTASSGQP